MKTFSTYDGIFSCHQCKSDVYSARFWIKTFDFTWMCDCGHVSKINLYGRGY